MFKSRLRSATGQIQSETTDIKYRQIQESIDINYITDQVVLTLKILSKKLTFS